MPAPGTSNATAAAAGPGPTAGGIASAAPVGVVYRPGWEPIPLGRGRVAAVTLAIGAFLIVVIAGLGIGIAAILSTVSDRRNFTAAPTADGLDRTTVSPGLTPVASFLTTGLRSDGLLRVGSAQYVDPDFSEPGGGIVVAAGSREGITIATEGFFQNQAAAYLTKVADALDRAPSDARLGAPTAYDPGPRGGGLSCASASGPASDGARASHYAICVWIDPDTIGIAISVDEAETGLAIRVAAMRESIER